MRIIIILVLNVIVGALANIFLKKGSLALPPLSLTNWWKIATSPWIIVGVVLFVVNFPLYSAILQKMKLAVAFPLVTSLTFITVVLMSMLILKESLTAAQYIGIVILIVGIWFLAK